MGMLDPQASFRPSAYPWAVEATKQQMRIHWLPDEAKMDQDVKDWKKMTAPQRSLATNIMLLFTQSDIDVSNGYVDHYLSKIQNGDVKRMLGVFNGQEVIHIFAYANLMETLGFPDSAFDEFYNDPAMRAKHAWAESMSSDDNFNLALTIASYGGFMEGLQLFASFIMLLNFQRINLLKGMGQIVAWSVRDENLHCNSISKMHKVFCAEYLSAEQMVRMREAVVAECRRAVEFEFNFIDKAYELGPVEKLSADDVKQYIMYMADRRLEGLGYDPIYGVKVDPQPWFIRTVGGVEHANFFEADSTAYSKSATTGTYSYDD